jgi:hypothetical protein
VTLIWFVIWAMWVPNKTIFSVVVFAAGEIAFVTVSLGLTLALSGPKKRPESDEFDRLYQ